MNYTGNPRHLRGCSRSSKKAYRFLQRARTPAIPERPHLDVCQAFQAPTESQTGSQVQSIATSSSSGEDRFNAKRRRLLQQQDWLGLDISAPINIYDIRAAKEKKRLSNGPFIRPLVQSPHELEGIGSPLKAPSELPYTPSMTPRSSTSLHPEPTIPSVKSSERGLSFIPSRHTTPLSAHHGSMSPRSSSADVSYNLFAIPQSSISQHSSVHEMDFFIPDAKNKEASRTSTMELGTVWNLVEKRKQEDTALRAELGWGSQSGLTGSQQTQDPSQSRDAFSSSHGQTNGQTNEVISELELSDISRFEHFDRLRSKEIGLLGENEVLPDLHLILSSGPIAVAREDAQTDCMGRAKLNLNGDKTSLAIEDHKPVWRPVILQQNEKIDRKTVACNTPTIIEEEDQSEGEDDGISWF